MRATSVECAEKVEYGGNFVFYYSGHGDKSQGKFVLVPTNFNEVGGISGDDLVEWLNDAKCKDKNVLFVLDCCYAGNLGTTLTLHEDLTIGAQLFVMCACAPGEKSLSIDALGHSIFTFY